VLDGGTDRRRLADDTGQERLRLAAEILENYGINSETNLSKPQVVKVYAHTIVAPVMDYWKQTIEGKKGDQLERMKVVRIFNPLHVLGRSPGDSC
jgi:hypothetical protein